MMGKIANESMTLSGRLPCKGISELDILVKPSPGLRFACPL
jgi:hypothetical protein